MQQNKTWAWMIGIIVVLLVGALGYTWYASRHTSNNTLGTPAKNRDQPTDNFTQEGNLVENNPGLRPGVWYLVYDKPGASASTVELMFTDASKCTIGTLVETCVANDIVLGARVRITGYNSGSQVFVHSYIQLDLEQKG
jgi:hypothetical protein